MSRFIAVSPTFGDFRAGEPVAFRIAEDALASSTLWELDKRGSYKGHRLEITHGTIKIWLQNDEKPFEFIIVDSTGA